MRPIYATLSSYNQYSELTSYNVLLCPELSVPVNTTLAALPARAPVIDSSSSPKEDDSAFWDAGGSGSWYPPGGAADAGVIALDQR